MKPVLQVCVNRLVELNHYLSSLFRPACNTYSSISTPFLSLPPSPSPHLHHHPTQPIPINTIGCNTALLFFIIIQDLLNNTLLRYRVYTSSESYAITSITSEVISYHHQIFLSSSNFPTTIKIFLPPYSPTNKPSSAIRISLPFIHFAPIFF